MCKVVRTHTQGKFINLTASACALAVALRTASKQIE